MKTFKERVESLKEEKRELEEDICSRAEEICNLANEYYPSGKKYYHEYPFTKVDDIYINSQDFIISYTYQEEFKEYPTDIYTFISKEYFDMPNEELVQLFKKMEYKIGELKKKKKDISST